MKKLFGALVALILLGCAPTPPPNIPTAGLDPAATKLIRQHVDEVRAKPRSADAWGKLGALLKSYTFSEQAETCLSQAARLDEKNPRWPYLLGTLGVDPLRNLRRAVAICGNEPETPRLRLARTLAEYGQPDAAREEAHELLHAKPNSGPARLLLAQLNPDTNEAIEMARACTSNAYTVRSAWTLLSTLYRRQGDTNASELASRRAAASTADAPWPDPFEDEVLALRNDARSLSDRAQSYLMAGRAGEAMPLVNQLMRSHPNFAETWLLLGRTQYLQNQHAAAEQSLRRFLAMDPGSVNGHFQLGMSLLAQKHYEEAATTFQHATSLKRDFGPAFFNLGFALAKSGKPREGVTAFQEAIRHNPEIIDAYILLADLHVQLGEKTEAGQVADLAERLNPTDRRLPALRQKISRPDP